MGILTPFKAKPKDLAAAEARAAERDRAETETRACILENAQARKAALLADASVEHIEQLDAAARQLHIALEKLALVRPILLAEVDGLRDAACGLHAAVAELRKAGFGRDADSLPVPPLHVVEMSGVAGTNGQILGNPNLDIFEDTAVRVHEQLAGGAK
jgi:hypothetical protein